MTAAIGITVGLGSLGIAVMVNILALIILALEGLERRVEDKQGSNDRGHDEPTLRPKFRPFSSQT